ncbi:hypothetical protein [Verrucosispora sioxanthis]|uniref:hypothetical protein n=1 Tax=Verrucosispora sioxanthis TaxID=2499994 RepID=UPI0020A04CF1|nr:hypothetical protein [Verrucosispora sioxanthis]
MNGPGVGRTTWRRRPGRVYRSLGDVVEPFRDELARLVVHGALHDATRAGAHPDSAPVARLTHHVEIVRDTFGGLVMVVRGFLFTAGAALLGLLALDATVAALVAAPLLAGLVVFTAALPSMLAHQRTQVRAGEAWAAGCRWWSCCSPRRGWCDAG